jgi:hypothetical protein
VLRRSAEADALQDCRGLWSRAHAKALAADRTR